MANLKRTLTKFGAGFLGGFSSGGWAGGFTGGTVAAMTGGKAKPLKSAAIGAGAGFLGGFTAQKLGWQGDTTSIGGYTFKPLSSRAVDWFGQSKTLTANGVTGAGSPGVPALPNIADVLGGGQAIPAELPPGSGPVGNYPLASDYQEGAQGGGGWLPVAVAAGAVFLLMGAA